MTAPKPGVERRVHRRRKPTGSVRVTCQAGAHGLGPNEAVGLLDVSEVSARLAVKAALAAGQDVELNFSEPSLGRPIKRMAVVLWCAEQAAGCWWVAARSDRRLEYAELTSLT